jgi:hypothetical protein
MVLIFVVMMLNLGEGAAEMERRRLTPDLRGPALPAVVLILRLFVLFRRRYLSTGAVDQAVATPFLALI